MRKLIFILFIFILCLYFSSTNLSISDLNQNEEITLEVKGDVKQDKIIKTTIDSTFDDVINQIELTDTSDISGISLLSKLYNNQVIVIPSKTMEKKISINNAGIDELISLPGIGKSTANKIIEYRNLNGSFISLEDLMLVNGIGSRKYEKIKPFICL